MAVGTDAHALAGNPANSGSDNGNIAITFGDHSSALAGAMSGDFGLLDISTNIGNGNVVRAVGDLDTAFAVFATNTHVNATPGPFAIAGSISQTGATVTKKGPGFNINGIKVGGAAAPAKAAAVGSSKKGTTRSAAAVKHSKK
jgi:hypothetical protein